MLSDSDKLKLYFDILKTTQEKVVFMEPRDSKRFYVKHIDEARLYLEYIFPGDTVLDVGSGAGFPGIPLALMRKEAFFYLLDRKRRHVDFLNEVIEKLEVENARAVMGRAEDCGSKFDFLFDKACARAVSRIANLLKWVEPVMKGGGFVILGKGRDVESEMQDAMGLPFRIAEIRRTDFGNIIVYEKIGKAEDRR